MLMSVSIVWRASRCPRSQCLTRARSASSTSATWYAYMRAYSVPHAGLQTASERGEHIDLCYEEQETNMDFAESSVLQAFAQSVSGPDSAASVDISARRCSCWTCGKPLDSLKLKSRVAHVADCTRLSVDQVQELFLPEGCDEVAELRVRKKWVVPQPVPWLKWPGQRLSAVTLFRSALERWSQRSSSSR